MTAADIAREHHAALASLTAAQRRAIERLRKAKQMTHFRGGTTAERLDDIFTAEARP